MSKSLFAIDLTRLEEEWQNQPLLYKKYAKELADARLALEEEKAELDVVRAELWLAIQENPADYGLSKTTVDSINAAILIQEEHKRQHTVVSKAKHLVDILNSYTTTLDHRKKALEKLVDLHGQNYFSMPRGPRVVSEAISERSARRARKRKEK